MGLLRHWAKKEKNSEKLGRIGRLELDEESRDGLSSLERNWIDFEFFLVNWVVGIFSFEATRIGMRWLSDE